MSYDPTKVAFVDTETTGLDPEWHEVWEVAVILPDFPQGEQEYVWQQRIRTETIPLPPPFDIDPAKHIIPGSVETHASVVAWSHVDKWVQDNTGIRERYDHETALDPAMSLIRLIELTRGRHLVGACPWFDSERLHRAILRQTRRGGGFPRDLPWHYHLIDVETLMVGWAARAFHDEPDGLGDFPRVPDLPWSSDDLSRAIGVEPPSDEDRHTALGDARWARRCYEAVMGGPS